MDNDFFVARIDPLLVDHIPTYMANRRKELEQLGQLLARKEHEKISELAQRMIGVGTPWGFAHITTLAKLMKEAAASRDEKSLTQLISEYRDFLQNVKIQYKTGAELWGRPLDRR